ncbi:hypothetical protein ALO95_200263 [Pseudomonas syringae pv. antirrhini]|uniref:alpha/beta hydrolase n=1 Tax=Pseudomonas TaxID=286 RepID=UPI00070FE4AF|nr:MULTISPECIES: alpha/beta hydrolase [Pseudomonas]RMP42522.1 hypothetical protein ALQ23_200271 [Pseudomonas syringae pv. antirrhini]RMW23450.1 hypothetical protein ALO95_200263 [Pseudomonas syringae pv. antirrhini]WIN08836.1 alpha/beta hydrolase [Pseudomonas syringae pv. antirrhini str. 126]
MLTHSPYSTPDEVSLQLDLINHMWDKAPYLEFVGRQSAAARQHLAHIADIRVGARTEERIDVFLSNREKSPIVVFIHGGWWRGGTRKDYSFCANGFVSSGYTVVISDYTLCPSATVSDITQASRAAVIWAYEHADEINGDKDRIFVVGHSAGGQQAAMISVTDWASHGVPADIVKAVVPMSGVFDMQPFQSSWLQAWLQLDGDQVTRESAIHHIKASTPPVMVMLGGEESEEFHRQSLMFVDALGQAGTTVEYHDMKDEDHSSLLFMLGNPDSEASKVMMSFFDRCSLNTAVTR